MELWLFICNVIKHIDILIKLYGKQILRRNNTIVRGFLRSAMQLLVIIQCVNFKPVLLPHGNRFQNTLDHKQQHVTPKFQDFFGSFVGILIVLSLLFCSQSKIEEILPVFVVCCRLKSHISWLKAKYFFGRVSACKWLTETLIWKWQTACSSLLLAGKIIRLTNKDLYVYLTNKEA